MQVIIFNNLQKNNKQHQQLRKINYKIKQISSFVKL